MLPSRAIDYPRGCYALSNSLEVAILLKRLKLIAKSFHEMDDESATSETVWKYNNLALYLASPFLVSHVNGYVKLLTAYSIANVLRICHENHPYETSQLKHLMAFLFNQLKGLGDTDDQISKLCQKILEILVKKNISKLYSILGNINELVINLFMLIINTVRTDMSIIIQDLLATLLGILILQLPLIPDQIIKMIFFNFKSKSKTSNKPAYDITVRLIQKYKNTLAPAIGKFLVKELFRTFLQEESLGNSLDTSCKDLPIHWMTRLWKLHAVCSDVAIPVMLCLESAIMTSHLNCRLTLIKFLARLFTAPSHIPVYKDYSALWKTFLGRFNDENPEVRMVCLQQVELLFKIKDLREDLLWELRKREMDPLPRIRIHVVSVVSTLIQLYPHEADAAIDDLFPIVEHRRLDGDIMVRARTLEKMAKLYSFFHSGTEKVGHEAFTNAMKAVSEYPKYILFNFWINPPNWAKDRLIVIQQLHTYLVPNGMTPEERMKRLIKMWISFDSPTCTTFMEIRYLQYTVRQHLLQMVCFLRRSKGHGSLEEKQAILNALAITCHLPLSSEAAFRIVLSFALKITSSEPYYKLAEIILLCASCETTLEAMNSLKKELNLPDLNLVLDLTADLLLDKTSTKIVVELLDGILQEKTMLWKDFVGNIPSVIKKIFFFLQGLSSSSPSYFLNQDVIYLLINWLHMPMIEGVDVQLNTLKILGSMQSSQKYSMEDFPALRDELVSICDKLCINANTKAAKWVIRSLTLMPNDRERSRPVFLSIFKTLCYRLTSKDMANYYNAIYCLGYISYYLGNYLREEIISLVTDKVIDDTIGLKATEPDVYLTWCEFNCLPIETQIKVRFIKFLRQCLNQVQNMSTSKILSILFKVLQEEGCNTKSPLSVAEKAWIRLAVGSSVLHILRGKETSILTCDQFYQLSYLMTLIRLQEVPNFHMPVLSADSRVEHLRQRLVAQNFRDTKIQKDEVPEVQNKFLQKLTSCMMFEFPKKSLPLDLLGIYFLMDIQDLDFEKSEESSLVSELSIVFSRRLTALANYKRTGLSPKNCNLNNHFLVYGLLAASHNKKFYDCDNLSQLAMIKQQIQFFLKAFLINQDDVTFYEKQLKMIKNHAVKGDDKEVNLRLWTLCDIMLMILKSKPKKSLSESRTQPTLPMAFFESKPQGNRKRILNEAAISLLSAPDVSKSIREEESPVLLPAEEDRDLFRLEESEWVENAEKTEIVGEGSMAIEEEDYNQIWEGNSKQSEIFEDEGDLPSGRLLRKGVEMREDKLPTLQKRKLKERTSSAKRLRARKSRKL